MLREKCEERFSVRLTKSEMGFLEKICSDALISKSDFVRIALQIVQHDSQPHDVIALRGYFNLRG